MVHCCTLLLKPCFCPTRAASRAWGGFTRFHVLQEAKEQADTQNNGPCSSFNLKYASQDCLEMRNVGSSTDGLPPGVEAIPGPRTQRQVPSLLTVAVMDSRALQFAAAVAARHWQYHSLVSVV